MLHKEILNKRLIAFENHGDHQVHDHEGDEQGVGHPEDEGGIGVGCTTVGMFDEALLFEHLKKKGLKRKGSPQASNFLSVSKSSGGEHHAPCLYMATGLIAKSCMISFQASESFF